MNSVPVVWRDVDWDYVQSRVGSYMNPRLYYDLRNHIYADFNGLYTNDLGCIEFSGIYRKISMRRLITILLLQGW